MTTNLDNAVIMLFLRAVILGAVAWYLKAFYGASIFYVELNGVSTHLLYGVSLIVLMWAYCELMVCFRQVIFNSRSGFIDPKPKNFVAEFEISKITVAINEAQVLAQLSELPPSFIHVGIVGVATRLADARIIWSPNLTRHSQLMWYANYVLGISTDRLQECEQGFIDSHGTYLCRKAAMSVALAAGQIRANEPIVADTLYSEDLF